MGSEMCIRDSCYLVFYFSYLISRYRYRGRLWIDHDAPGRLVVMLGAVIVWIAVFTIGQLLSSKIQEPYKSRFGKFLFVVGTVITVFYLSRILRLRSFLFWEVVVVAAAALIGGLGAHWARWHKWGVMTSSLFFILLFLKPIIWKADMVGVDEIPIFLVACTFPLGAAITTYTKRNLSLIHI